MLNSIVGAGVRRTDHAQTCSHGRHHCRWMRQFVRTCRHAMHMAAAVIVLVSAVAFSASTTASTASAAPERIATKCSTGVPEKDCRAAEYVYNFVVSHNYAAPPGLKGNTPFRDEFGLLPPGGDYREYRLYGAPGSVERLVIDRNIPEGNSWFTNDHYASFVQFYLTL